MRTAAGDVAVVGQSLNRLQTERRRRLDWIITAALGPLALGSLGRGVVARIALRPLLRLSAEAAEISPAARDRRLSLATAPIELVPLAEKLNSASDRMEESLTRQRQFTADASHELRTPLVDQSAELELALDRDRTPERYREALGACQRHVRRMQSLVERLLSPARADANALALHREPLDLAELIRQRVASLQALARPRGVIFDSNLSDVQILGDRTALEQLVDNLLSNAVRHSPEQGRVEVTLQRSRATCELIVADAGTGIPEADRERVFERFARLETSHSSASGGAGLGLALCREIVRAHGGDISVHTSASGGAALFVLIPALTATDEPQAATASAAPVSQAL